jgi:hypothetical protein
MSDKQKINKQFGSGKANLADIKHWYMRELGAREPRGNVPYVDVSWVFECGTWRKLRQQVRVF